MHPYELNAAAVPRVGLGCASISREWSTAEDAAETIAAAWEGGIRYFDTAPFYGYGLSEHRVGQALAGQSREDYVLSSKVGRIVDEPNADGVGTGCHFDFSADAIKRSLDASLKRLGTDRIDLLLIHDAGGHWETAINEAWPVLEDLRAQGVVRAVGAGMTQAPMLARFARETSMDYFLLAGRYSLLDRTALDELFPLCVERGIGVLVAQMLHGGLIEGVPNPQIYYRPVPPAIAARVDRIAAVCRAHGVPMAAAAIQFPLAHPVVTGIVTGPGTREQVHQNLGWLEVDIPPALWEDLKRAGLLEADTSTPGTTPSHP
jgi:D-threo-aldose 1-dehydrogenase